AEARFAPPGHALVVLFRGFGERVCLPGPGLRGRECGAGQRAGKRSGDFPAEHDGTSKETQAVGSAPERTACAMVGDWRFSRMGSWTERIMGAWDRGEDF